MCHASTVAEFVTSGGRGVDTVTYARALAIMNSNPQADEKMKADVTAKLTDYYKQRHQDSEAGLTELIAGVLEKPLP